VVSALVYRHLDVVEDVVWECSEYLFGGRSAESIVVGFPNVLDKGVVFAWLEDVHLFGEHLVEFINIGPCHLLHLRQQCYAHRIFVFFVAIHFLLRIQFLEPCSGSGGSALHIYYLFFAHIDNK